MEIGHALKDSRRLNKEELRRSVDRIFHWSLR
jgi:hypothetical protein